MFITLEGSEGAGKSTQIADLADYLRGQGYSVLLTREPGGTPIGEQIRAVLWNSSNADMSKRAEILLFQAARAQLVERVIRPALERGEIVLCDRYADSTLAYQGYGYHLFELDTLKELIRFATGGLQPDLTLLLDLDVEVGLGRRAKGGESNRLDQLEMEIYQRVREGYLEMAQEDPGRWVLVDASKPPEQVQQELRKLVQSRLSPV
jgi:dTMP kinase